MAALAIYSKRVLLPDGMGEATVFVEGELIVGVVRGLVVTEGVELVDVGDRAVMPGVIDPHVHINEPGRADWEGFDTASRAAIAGGLTMLVDMPLNSSPVTTTVEAFDRKLAAMAGQLHCDCGLWGGVVPGNAGNIRGLIARGVLGFKAFLTHSGIDEFPNVGESDLRKVMPVIAEAGLPLLVHCELESGVIGETGRRVSSGAVGGGGSGVSGDPRSYRNYLLSRPAKWEDDAIALMIRLCEEYRCRTHIVHLSSASSIEPIRRAKERGLPLTVETAQHYLYFSAEGIADGQTYLKCAPPIRERINNERLWEALREGVIDVVATDHSPAPPAMKSGDLMTAWGGISSLQLALPVLWTAAERRGFGVEDVARWLCVSPAVLVGETMRRGKIAPGYRADLVVWDPEGSLRVEADGLFHRHKGTPYLGEELYGVVEQTWLGGKKVYDRRGEWVLGMGKPVLRGTEVKDGAVLKGAGLMDREGVMGGVGLKDRAEVLRGRIEELAAISEDVQGITRRYGTAAAVTASEKVLEWMREAGLQARVDAIGNIRGRWESAERGAKTLVIASHIDTVVNAGKWDGPLGVLTGLNILEHMIREGRSLPFHIELIAFCDEEGVRFHTTYLGSKVVAGNFSLEALELRDVDGVSLAETVLEIGGNPWRLEEEAIAPEEWAGYFEIHIEQGPVLYEKNVPVAVVSAIAGQVRAEVVFSGMAGHAGTVPMGMRRDALCGAAEFVLGVERLAGEVGSGIVATVGKLAVKDAASNVIPGEVHCSVDIRSADAGVLLRGREAIRMLCEEIGEKRGLEVKWKVVQESGPVQCDVRMNELLGRSIEACGYEVLELVSGAGHDAVPVSSVSPVCMLFVRCFEGISHNPKESVERDDLAAAVGVAEQFLHQLTSIWKYPH